MKVLLVQPYFIDEDMKEQKIMKPYPPLGILYISSFLENRGIKNKVFDGTFSDRSEFYGQIREYKPDVLAFYCNLMTKSTVVDMMTRCRENHPEIRIVVGGPDVRYNVENYLLSGADFAVIGEGEVSFYELIEAVKAGDEDFGRISGIAFKKKNVPVVNKERDLIKNIDELPFPAYHKINLQPYLNTWKNHHGLSMLSISTQRGCPYTCKWCSTAVYGQTYRRRSPGKVLEEIRWLKNTYNPDALWFVDDVFTVSHKWLEEFMQLTERENLSIPFECISRADRLNKEVMKHLKKAGCFRIWIGAESGSQKILDAMDRRVQAGQVRDMIHLARENGIETGTFIMLGYPGETIKDIDETINHLVLSDPDYFTITLAYPIKGTALFEEIETSLTGNFDWRIQSDRERDFKRNYSNKFYAYAIKKVVSEVLLKKAIKKGGLPTYKKTMYFLKSRMADLLMKAEINSR